MTDTRKVDLVVLGGGTANKVASAAAMDGLETVLIEKGPLGGTCLNRGCNPSKMLIQHANRRNAVADADRFGIDATVEAVDFEGVVDGVTATLSGIADGMADSKHDQENLTLVEAEGRFVDDRTIEADSVAYRGEQVLLAAGTRPLVVDAIDGIGDVDCLTSRDAIRLRDRPDELVVLGGGYIAAELGYYFDAFGTDVTLIEMMDTLLPREDDEVSEVFTDIVEERHRVYTGYRATAVDAAGDGIVVTAKAESSDTIEVAGDELLVALGRRPNTDRVGIENTAIEIDDRGFVETDRQLRTTADGVWALGDIVGQHPFKHAADYEAEVVTDNLLHGAGRAVDYDGLSHAVFTEPQVAGVGRTESELREEGVEYVVGRAEYADAAMSRALKIDEGLVKVLAAPDGEVLGCHLVGHEASMLVHEATLAVRNGLSVEDVAGTIHVHPAMNKVLETAFRNAAAKLR
jgi:dihydrolipoamide dehydrogenase